MKVKELIEALMETNPEYPVLLSKDSEGNNFSPISSRELGGVGCYMMRPEETGMEAIIGEENAEEEGIEYKEDCVVLWPD